MFMFELRQMTEALMRAVTRTPKSTIQAKKNGTMITAIIVGPYQKAIRSHTQI